MRCLSPVLPGSLCLSDGRPITLVEVLGAGAHGTVHRAVLESGWAVKRPVAVKIFDLEPDDDHGQILRRLGRIARRSACVRHPNVVSILELDRAPPTSSRGAPRPFLVSELVNGESLEVLLDSWREKGLRAPVDFALVTVLKAAEGLGAALFTDDVEGGLTGLLHGDVSPRQILVSDQGEVKIGDFGQSLLRDVVSRVRSRKAIAYVAPEVACGVDVTARSDVFSLGVILHEMLIGPRFASGTDMGEAVAMVRDGRIHMNLIEPNLPHEIRSIIDRATAPDPTDRFPHARALAFELRREMLRMGLLDAQTCVRQAVVGWCELRSAATEVATITPPPPRHSDVVPKDLVEDTNPEIPIAKLRRLL